MRYYVVTLLIIMIIFIIVATFQVAMFQVGQKIADESKIQDSSVEYRQIEITIEMSIVIGITDCSYVVFFNLILNSEILK